MVEKKQLNVRIPVELQERIENDDRSKVDIVVEALELYFDSKKHLDDSKNDMTGNSNASKNDMMGNSNASKNDMTGNSNASKNDMTGNSNASKNDMTGNSNASKNDMQGSNAINNDNCISKFEPIDSDGIARMKNEIEYLRSKVDDMIKLLHQEQVLHIQTQHMLTATPQVMKKWWQFWR